MARCLLALALAASSCSPSPSTTRTPHLAVPVAALVSAHGRASLDAAGSIGRVERGLVPEVRVKGEQGWPIEERLRVHHVPGVSVAVVHDYRVVWAKGYGVADVSTGAPLLESTPFEAASISKMATALAALRWVEAGQLALEADVNRTLRSWHVPENDLTRATPVTLKHLLSHTGGTTVSGFIGCAEGEPVPGLLQVLDGAAPSTSAPVRVDTAPGTAFRYSGGGTSIVQQILIDVSGRAFPELMRDAVLAPLGMDNSTFEQPLPAAVAVRAAAGHDFDGKGIPGGRETYPQMAAAGLSTTPTDLARMLIELQLALEGRSRVLSCELAARMMTPIAPVTDDADTDVGLGTFLERHGGFVYFGHDGLNEGFVSVLRGSETKGNGAVVMANGFAAAPLVLEILRSIAVEYGWDGWMASPIERAYVDPAHLATLAGRYAAAGEPATVITATRDGLIARRPFEDSVELVPVGPDVFVSRAEGAKYTFQRAPSGVNEILGAPREGRATALTPIADVTPDALTLLEAGRVNESLAAYRRLLALNPRDPVADEAPFDAAGTELLYRRVDPAGAVSVFRVDVALHPNSARAHAALAESYLRDGRRAEAVAPYERAVALFQAKPALSEHDALWLRWRLTRLKRLGLRPGRP